MNQFCKKKKRKLCHLLTLMLFQNQKTRSSSEHKYYLNETREIHSTKNVML